MSTPKIKPAHPFEALDQSGPETRITEGSTTIRFPKGQVFYNPVQQFNRDLSTTVIKTFAQDLMNPEKRKRGHTPSGLTLLEGLSATGLRSIRYAKEIPAIEKIYANDMDPTAVSLIKENILLNNSESDGLPLSTHRSLSSIIEPCEGDANATMLRLKNQSVNIHVIDLDPYGSAAPFIDSAVQAVADGGLLCVTCTDLAVLCSTHPETCFAKYGGMPLHGEACHEGALRLVIQAIESSANRYKRHVVPLMSCSIDFYVRVFLRIVESPLTVKRSSTLRGVVPRCVQCKSIFSRPFAIIDRTTSKREKSATKSDEKVVDGNSGNQRYIPNPDSIVGNRCPVCLSRLELCGPMWLGPLHDRDFVRRVIETNKTSDREIIKTADRIEGFASVIAEELDNGSIPFFTALPDLARFFRASVPPMIEFRSALLNANFRVSSTHCEPQGIKTDAPIAFIWKIMTKWIEREHPSKLPEEGSDTPQARMMSYLASIESSTPTVSFERHVDANPPSRSAGLKRFPENPTRNWGPLARAKQARLD